jgi:4a-hydroxytetrahydrobiopterin dehydratase
MTWIERDDALERDFHFPDFSTAFAFMTAVALAAEKMDHHPDWRNVYDRVHIRLNTHSAGNTITEKDRRLAGIIDRLYRQHGDS